MNKKVYQHGFDDNLIVRQPWKAASAAGNGNLSNGQKESEDYRLIDAELGISEDHFSRPEGLFGFTTVEELEMVIEHCKEMILESLENTLKRKQLVKKLVELRWKLQQLKEEPPEKPPDVRLVFLGHYFEKGAKDKSGQICEKCCSTIWTVWQKWYSCRECHFVSHEKCLNLVTRQCARLKVEENPQYVLDLCPEVGLSVQNYRCAECRCRIVSDGERDPRRCDYNGYYYCNHCHWNNMAIIPARVVHNWDFSPKKVCQSTFQFLSIMRHRPVLNLDQLNPMLYTFVAELRVAKKLRSDILVMKQYFQACQAALRGGILLRLRDRQHFVENVDVYCLQDLIDLINGELINYLEDVHRVFREHITKKCESCRGKGFYCELCGLQDEVLFPFSKKVTVCSGCSYVFHRVCFEHKGRFCPRCERKRLAHQARMSSPPSPDDNTTHQ